MVENCPFCNMRWNDRHKSALPALEKGVHRFEVRLTRDKWIRVCEADMLTLNKYSGIAMRTDYREPHKLDSYDKSLVDMLKGTSARANKPIPVSQVLTGNENKHKKDNMQRIQGTLDFHVLGAIRCLESDGLTFSAYDVTKLIRKLVNDGEIEIIGRPFSPVNTPGGNVIQSQKVEHNEVRDRVHYFFEQNTFPNITRHNNGTYWEYSPVAQGTTAPATTSQIGGSSPFAGVVQPAPAAAPVPPPITINTATAAAPAASVAPAPAPVATVAPAPAKDPITELTENTKPLIRLKHVATQKYITLPNGRSAWSRRCDLTQALLYGTKNAEVADDVRAGIDNGTIEVVTV